MYSFSLSNILFLLFPESSCRSFLQQPLSESVQAGGSVSLNCTVHTGTSDGEHSVYWFRKDTGKSHLGILYVHTHSSSRCVKAAGSESPAQSRCVYNLWKRSVSLSDAGTYYCAVASCGEILFGGGTRLEVEGEQNIISTCSPSFHVIDGEHSVYWFRKDTGKSHLGILYVHTHSSSRCVKAAGSESPAQSRCVYNLWKRSVSLSDAGTYYCAVASCGEILFGGGTRLEVEGEQNIISTCSPSFHVMYLQLISQIHPFSKTRNIVAVYVAVDYRKKQSKSRKQRSEEEETVYSGVRLTELE
uniref:Ig-like domain-containing protein n=1 Tax=Seriola lalandi dorsalis TaxID=1841481 RepID=A0A3B4Y2S7_SERLL